VTFDRLRNWRILPTLRVAEVAAIVGISQREVRRRIADGRLPSVLEGGTRLVPVSAVLEIEARAQRATGEITARRGKVLAPRHEKWIRRLATRGVG
jgi:excisionase family DNA binding protein